MKARLVFALFFASFLIGCKSLDYAPVVKSGDENASVLIRQVNIFNGRDDHLLEGMDVLVQDGRISKIGPSISGDGGEMVVDGKGKTLMPGLIDAHVHLSGSGAAPWANYPADMPHNLQAYLYTGITTVYDLGGISKQIEKLADQVEEGKLLGPTIFHTHVPITVKNSHPIPLTKELMGFPMRAFVNSFVPTVDSPEKAPELIKKYVRQEIDFVKVIVDEIPPGSPQMSREELAAVVAAAHAEGYKVFVHIGSPQNAVDAVDAGADILAHGVWRGKLSPEQARHIAKSGVPMIYTLSGFTNVDAIQQGAYQPGPEEEKLVSPLVTEPVTGDRGKEAHSHGALESFFESVVHNSPHMVPNLKLLLEAGVPIIVGTDSNLPGTYAGASYIQEMGLLQDGGMTNFEVLTGATYLASKLFIEEPDFGLVEEGFRANLLLLDGNPLKDLDVVKAPALILKDGVVVDRID